MCHLKHQLSTVSTFAIAEVLDIPLGTFDIISLESWLAIQRIASRLHACENRVWAWCGRGG